MFQFTLLPTVFLRSPCFHNARLSKPELGQVDIYELALAHEDEASCGAHAAVEEMEELLIALVVSHVLEGIQRGEQEKVIRGGIQASMEES